MHLTQNSDFEAFRFLKGHQELGRRVYQAKRDGDPVRPPCNV